MTYTPNDEYIKYVKEKYCEELQYPIMANLIARLEAKTKECEEAFVTNQGMDKQWRLYKQERDTALARVDKAVEINKKIHAELVTSETQNAILREGLEEAHGLPMGITQTRIHSVLADTLQKADNINKQTIIKNVTEKHDGVLRKLADTPPESEA